MNTFDNEELLHFLDELKDKIINDKIDDKTIQYLGEFYMFNKFKEELNKTEIEEKELIKFLVLGWYIYNIILKENKLKE